MKNCLGADPLSTLKIKDNANIQFNVTQDGNNTIFFILIKKKKEGWGLLTQHSYELAEMLHSKCFI